MKTLKVYGRHVICGFEPEDRNLRLSLHEVWHTPSGGKRDDHKSVGYIFLKRDADFSSVTEEAKFRKEHGPYFELSVMSTKISSQFHKNWDLVLELPAWTKE